jgi:5-methylcytosine-specific restriction endonuclease McrA
MIEFARAMDDLGIDIDTLCPCGQEEVSHVDHIQPDSLDGTDDFENLRFLGAHCNTSRGNRTDWKPATSWLDAPQWSEPPNAFTTE